MATGLSFLVGTVFLLAVTAENDELGLLQSACVMVEIEDRAEVACGLPSGGVAVSVERVDSSLDIICHGVIDNYNCNNPIDTYDCTYNCSELASISHCFADFTSDVTPYLTINYCSLPPSPLSCLLSLVNATKVFDITIQTLPRSLEPVHVQGLENVKELTIRDAGPNITAVPYKVLSALPRLSSFKLTKGELVLYPESYGESETMESLQYLELSQGKLRRLPAHAFANTPRLASLWLYSNLITDIHEDAFSGLSNLRNLSLNGNRLVSLPAGVFHHTPSLQHVDLYYNMFHRLSANLFGGLAHLKLINLFDNREPLVLDPLVFANLASLAELRLAGCRIQTLPADLLVNSTSLRHLDLSRNLVVELPGRLLSGLTQLEYLDLSKNKLRKWPPKIFAGLDKMTTLYLQKNDLAALENEAFFGLVHLQKLDLSQNKLHALNAATFSVISYLEINLFDNREPLVLEPLVFANLASLAELRLAGCRIQTLPADLLVNSTSLRHLDLSRNLVVEFPGRLLSGLTQLEYLDLSKNKLRKWPPKIFAGLDKMTTLYLQENDLAALENEAFSGLVHLQKLDLSQNKLHALNAATFSVMPYLKDLSVSHNNLSLSGAASSLYWHEAVSASAPIHKSPFASLRHLRRLRLAHNHIAHFAGEWRFAPALTRLDLSHNAITELTNMNFLNKVEVDLTYNNITNVYPGQYSFVASLAKIHLDHNPFDCGCQMYPLLTFLQSKTGTSRVILDNARCASPPHMVGQRVAIFNSNDFTCEPGDCPQNCKCTYQPSISNYALKCHKYPDISNFKLKSINLSLRSVTDLPTTLPHYVQFLNLSSLNLKQAPYINNSLEIDLTNNLLENPPKDLFRQNSTLRLSQNPFQCTCATKNDIIYFRKHETQILDYQKITCANGVRVTDISIGQLCANRDATVIRVCVSVAALLIIVFITVCFVYKREIRILLKKYGLWCGEEYVCEKKYHAFVSYAHQDKEYVTEKLIPNLENGDRPLRLCIHERDWVIGDFIPDQITRSVEQSQITIVVLSKFFLDSDWGQMEFRAAYARGKVVILLLEDISNDSLDKEIKSYLSTNTYIRADDPLVWDRLKDAARSKKFYQDQKPQVGLDVQLFEGVLVNNAQKDGNLNGIFDNANLKGHGFANKDLKDEVFLNNLLMNEILENIGQHDGILANTDLKGVLKKGLIDNNLPPPA